jgi:siroheme synthase-like protein
MPFDYVIALDLDGRRAVVVGGGPVAAGRVADLRHAGANVLIVSPAPSEALGAVVADDAGVSLLRRGYTPGDLAGAAIAIATGEDALDVDAFWAESRAVGALASVLDDLGHTDFAAPALVRRGDLRVAVSTAGRAPALAKRVRRLLEDRLGDPWADLVDLLARVRAEAGPRDVPFDEWAGRWEAALDDVDLLVGLLAAGRGGDVRRHVLAHVRPGRIEAGHAVETELEASA